MNGARKNKKKNKKKKKKKKKYTNIKMTSLLSSISTSFCQWIYNIILYLWNWLIRTIIRYTTSGGGGGDGDGVGGTGNDCNDYSSYYKEGCGETIVFENGRRIRTIRRIAEGGFSMIYLASDLDDSCHETTKKKQKLALKRILCPEREMIYKCREEANVHLAFCSGLDGGGDDDDEEQQQEQHHANLMPLLGFKMERERVCGEYFGTVCFMLFPLLKYSLRDEISERKLLSPDAPHDGGIRPWKEVEILEIFAGVVNGVRTMHEAGYSHRDVKLENVLMDDNGGGGDSGDKDVGGEKKLVPVLMDFGSVGPVTVPIHSRSDVLSLVDNASSHCTISYRAPELFEGGMLRHGPHEPDVDFGKCDVWSLGCLLFGLMYGSSPFECEFRGECVRIVECSYLRVLGRIPSPMVGTDVSSRYSIELNEMVGWILNQDRLIRPHINDVEKRVFDLLKRHGKIIMY